MGSYLQVAYDEKAIINLKGNDRIGHHNNNYKGNG